MQWTSYVHEINQLYVEEMVERSNTRHLAHLVRHVWPCGRNNERSVLEVPLIRQGGACSLKYGRQGTCLKYLQVKPVDDQGDDSAFV